jgi:hypothetical protein
VTSEELEILVFADKDGNYYALPRQVWERARVPEEYRAEVQQLLGGSEVTGFEAFQSALNLPGGGVSIGSFTAPSGLQVSPMGTQWSRGSASSLGGPGGIQR